MKNGNKQMYTLRLESITVPILLLIYFFEFFNCLFSFSVNQTEGKRMLIAKFLTQKKTILEQFRLLSVIQKGNSKHIYSIIFTPSLPRGLAEK